MNKSILIEKLKSIGVIQQANLTLRSGETSNVYCDIKKAYGCPDTMQLITKLVGETMPAGTTCVAGSGHGGIPLAAVVSFYFGKKFSAIRGAVKNHGLPKLIDGYVPDQSDRVCIVDDVLTSGTSITETYGVLRGMGITRIFAVVLVRRGSPVIPVPYQHILRLEELTG